MTAVQTIKSFVPKLRFHKATRQAYAVFNGKAVYFGRSDDPQSSQKYHQFVAEWITSGNTPHALPDEITVAELIAQFWIYAQSYYVHADGSHTNEPTNIRLAMRPLNMVYGHTKVKDFGPRALMTVRQKMIEQGICRSSVNKRINRIRLMFKWGVANELVPGNIFPALQAVAGLRRGRSPAKETDPVRPVPQEHIDVIQPYVSKQVWALIQLQLLTAARSGELVIMRPCDIDMSGKIWIYKPYHHKTQHHGHDRNIYIGPRGQEILRPFLFRPADSYCFSPQESIANMRLERAKNRKTPKKYGNLPGTNIKLDPKRQAGKHYTPTGLGHSVLKGIKRAFRPKGMSDEEFKTWKPPQHWHPHQLRHNAATFLRKEFGLETARVILGHRSAAITEVYAELDQQKAMEAVVRVG
ncbi:MAG: hypothetical protein A2Y10_08795 [Planctomycetes bacterium GWF2_41_51]|nr:MAG: hypothetical protein A2Y10_08795 [Planctomycetes bacterium GWF2_41_51]